MGRAQRATKLFFTQTLHVTHTSPAVSLSESYGGRWPSERVRLNGELCGPYTGQYGRSDARTINSMLSAAYVLFVLPIARESERPYWPVEGPQSPPLSLTRADGHRPP